MKINCHSRLTGTAGCVVTSAVLIASIFLCGCSSVEIEGLMDSATMSLMGTKPKSPPPKMVRTKSTTPRDKYRNVEYRLP